MGVLFENDWAYYLKDAFESEDYKALRQRLKTEYASYKIYPDSYDIFNALFLTSYKDTKAVILGQDPYHEEGQAHGLSFSVPKGMAIPPSLVNIYKELNNDLGIPPADHGCLTKWAKQGVLLLNSVLTVRSGQAASHKGLGWETFTDSIISMLNGRAEPVVFILWGNFAIGKKPLITNSAHLVLTSAHPSPLSASRGFFGSRPFSKTNDFLVSIGKKPIDWDLNRDDIGL